MAFVAGKNSRVVVGDTAFSSWITQLDVSQDLDLANVTVLDSGGGHKLLPTLDGGTVSWSGPLDNDGAADGQDETIKSLLGAASGTPASVAWEGFAVGNRVASLVVDLGQYATRSDVTDAVRYQARAITDDETDRGVSLHDLTAETTTGNGSSVDNTASSSNGGAAYLHVTAVSGTSPTATIKVQHSADNSAWADLATFTAATAVTSERVVVSGTVNRYVRASWTLGGTTPSFTFVVTFARR